MSSHAPIIAIVGQTATGKSDLAIDLAHRINGEVINADAMQFYRGMNIGTAKVTSAQMRGIPHHLFDVLDVTQEASVAIYQEQARETIARIRSRGATPILVGGSGLYVRAALDDMEFPPTDPAVRQRYYDRLEAEGLEALYSELDSKDPQAAASIEPRNDRRIVRALEVIELTGKPFAASLPRQQYVEPTLQFALEIDLGELDKRIEARVENMWDSGLVAEVESLLEVGLAQGPTASRAVGYAETIRHLNGELTQAETKQLIAQSTRQLARRQRRWFKRDARVKTIPAPVDGGVLEELIAEL